ncbi:MAG: hypothetical protein KGD63_06175 [Candidatus Lokiarchaeota archaeon]|nr:hypothetical protein [Candidatus Lokiarchaeota archaeon]
MTRYKNFQRKIQKYERKISKSRIKLKRKLYKFKDYVFRVGISTKEEFELSKPSESKISFPCHLGIVSIGKINLNSFQKIEVNLERKFDSFFFNIYNLGRFKFPKEVFKKGIKKEIKEIKNTAELLELHPTNKIYQLLIDLAKRNELDMILAITDLPLYSSSNSNIIFLFGEAHIKHNCCVVSSLKLKEEYYNRIKNKELLELRLIKETTHELGHLILGPEHCNEDSCVMTFSREIEGIDYKSIRLCDKCYEKLINLREVCNF